MGVDGRAPLRERVRACRADRQLRWRFDRAVLPGAGARADGLGARRRRSRPDCRRGCDRLDAIIALNAHPSRSRLSTEWLDPAIHDEAAPLRSRCGARHVSPGQRAAVQRRVHPSLPGRAGRAQPSDRGVVRDRTRLAGDSPDAPTGLEDIAFTIHGTGADLRFLDGNIDPSDREIGVTLHGAPQVANYLPAMISRSSTLSLVPQPVVDRPHDGRLVAAGCRGSRRHSSSCSARPTRPCCPTWPARCTTRRPPSTRRDLHFVKGGTHYFENQPELLVEALDVIAAWLDASNSQPSCLRAANRIS